MPEFLIKNLEELVKKSQKSVPSLSAQAESLLQHFKNSELNSENYVPLLSLDIMLERVNGMARRLSTSHPEQHQYITKIRLLLADLDANLCREAPNSSTDSRIPLNIFKDSHNKLLDCQFLDPLTAAVYQLEQLVRPELYVPVIHVIKDDGYGEGIVDYFVVEPGLKFSRTYYWGVARDDPRLADIDMEMRCTPY